MLIILVSDTFTYLSYEIINNNTDIVLVSSPLNTLKNLKPHMWYLEYFVRDNTRFFFINTIFTLSSFELHKKLYFLLDIYPELKQKIYTL